MSKKTIDRATLLGSYPVRPALLRLAIPSMISSMVLLIYNFADTYFIGLLDNHYALAAVSVTFPIFTTASMLGVFFSTSTNALCSKSYGAGHIEDAEKFLSRSFSTTLGIGLLFCSLIIIFLDPLLRFLGATQNILPYARAYSFWIALMLLASIPNYALSGALRAQGFTSIVSNTYIFSTLINILLCYILVFPAEMGIGGAGLATALSSAIVTSILLFYTLRSKNVIIKPRLKYFLPTLSFFTDSVKVGASSMVNAASTTLLSLVYNKVAVAQPDGEMLLAAVGVMFKLITIPINIAYGYRQSLLSVLSYSVGNNNSPRFKEAVRVSFDFMALMSGLFFFIFLLTGKVLLNLFTDSPVAVNAGYIALLCNSVLAFGVYGSHVIMAAYQALGDLKTSSLVAAIRTGFLAPSLLLFLTATIGMAGFYVAPAVADAVTIVIVFFMYKKIKERSL